MALLLLKAMWKFIEGTILDSPLFAMVV